MTTSLAGPGPIRLQREAVRIVSIPYATPFSRSGGKQNLDSAVSSGMGSDAIVKKRTLKLRLEAPGIGWWYCPRRSDGHKGKLIHLLPKEQAPRYPGYCQIEDPQANSGKCGRKLKPEETHWHEMAEAFGFLESQGDSYIYGKFGQLSKYLSEIEQYPPAYFDFDRARLALSLDSLLENHGDFVLPVLWAAENPENHGQDWTNSVLEAFRACLRTKVSAVDGESINAAHAATGMLRKVVEEKLDAFDSTRHEGVRRGISHETKDGSCKCGRLLLTNVQAAYVTRTRTYLADLGVIEELSGRNKAYQLTDLGRNLVAELRRAGFMVKEDTCHIPPGFEAIHDVLSIDMGQYLRRFSPPFSRRIMEKILMGSLFPSTEPVEWYRHRTDLANILPRVVKSVGSKVNDGARIDTVRAAVFLFQIGRGIPTVLEDTDQDMPNDDSGVRRNAIVSLAAADSDNYLLGSARVGRRLWSINLLRNPSHYV